MLGLVEERNVVVEGEFISQLTGFPNAKMHIVYLGLGDVRHSVELVQYLEPEGVMPEPTKPNTIGVGHLGIIVDDLDAFYKKLSSIGVKFVNAPANRTEATYPWAKKACYLQDPDGNWLEFIERDPQPDDALIS